MNLQSTQRQKEQIISSQIIFFFLNLTKKFWCLNLTKLQQLPEIFLSKLYFESLSLTVVWDCMISRVSEANDGLIDRNLDYQKNAVKNT